MSFAVHLTIGGKPVTVDGRVTVASPTHRAERWAGPREVRPNMPARQSGSRLRRFPIGGPHR